MLPIFPLNIDVRPADENVIKEEGYSPHCSEDDKNIVEHSKLVQNAKDSAVEEEDAQFDRAIGDLLDHDQSIVVLRDVSRQLNVDLALHTLYFR